MSIDWNGLATTLINVGIAYCVVRLALKHEFNRE